MNADYRYLPNGQSVQGMAAGAQMAAPVAHPGMAQPMPGVYAYYGQQYPQYPAAQKSSSLFGFTNDRFLKGLLIGAAATYLLTNDNVQRAAIKGVVKAWSLVQGGVEELKERFQDAEAELRAGEAAPDGE